MKEKQVRNVRDHLSKKIKQKHLKLERDKQLNSLREKKHEHESELGMFDFIFSFGGLC